LDAYLHRVKCLPIRKTRKSRARGPSDAIDRAPQGRELSVREALSRIIVDWWDGKRGVGHRLPSYRAHPRLYLAVL